MKANKLVKEQNPPTASAEHPAVWDLVIEEINTFFNEAENFDDELILKLVIKDMKDRDDEGYRKYNTRLQPFNGRDGLIDAYQEFLDGAVYLRQKLYEEEGAELKVLYNSHLKNLICLRELIFNKYE